MGKKEKEYRGNNNSRHQSTHNLLFQTNEIIHRQRKTTQNFALKSNQDRM